MELAVKTYMNIYKPEQKNLLGVELPSETKEEVLENIIKYTKNPYGNCVIMSLNPEIFVLIHDNKHFKKAVQEAQIKIIDGVGVMLAARLLHIPVQGRITGVDLTDDLIHEAAQRRMTIMLIGGQANVAESLADCYKKRYPSLNILGFQGIENISAPKQSEEEKIFSIVADTKPQIIFFAFGSPMQELWVSKHKTRLKGIVCAGVGGTFDFLSGKVPRAPKFVRFAGLEWLYRLIKQPWRWRRQLRLLTFVKLVLLQMVGRRIAK